MAHPGTCYAAWIAVDDADAGNGGLFVQPGTHHAGLCSPARGDAKTWGSIIPQPDHAACREVTMAAGDVLFFHYFTLHGSMPNRSQKIRKTVLAQMHSGEDRIEDGTQHSNSRLVLSGWNYQAKRSLGSQS